MNKSRGFSLLEMLISMALGLMLMTLVGQIFISIENMNNTVRDELFLQENMRLAFQLLGNQIRMAGHEDYLVPSLLLDQAIHIRHAPDGNDSITLNGKDTFEIRNSAFPEGKAKKSLYERIELVPGLDQLHATLIKNAQGKPLISLELHMTAPHGMTKTEQAIFALREYVS